MVLYTLFTELLQPPEIGGERFFGGGFGDPIPVGIEVVGGSSVLPTAQPGPPLCWGTIWSLPPPDTANRAGVLGPGWRWRRTKLSNSTVAVWRGALSQWKTKPWSASLGLLCLNLFNKILSRKCPYVNRAIFSTSAVYLLWECMSFSSSQDFFFFWPLSSPPNFTFFRIDSLVPRKHFLFHTNFLFALKMWLTKFFASLILHRWCGVQWVADWLGPRKR